MRHLLLLLLITLSAPISAKEKIYMTSLDWPPYSGKDLAENGVSIAIAREAFAKVGYDLVVDFQPWVRTVRTAARKEKYIGYFPEYEFETDEFVFSDSIGLSPLGFVEQVAKPVRWDKLEDLTQYRIGVVQGYVNTKEFDQLVAQGEFSIEASTDDLRNIHKVAKGRLDLAVIDANVLKYLIHSGTRKEVLLQRIQMNEKMLELKKIVVAFRNTEEGRKWRDIFNKGLAQINVSEVIERLSHSTHLHQAIDLRTMIVRTN